MIIRLRIALLIAVLGLACSPSTEVPSPPPPPPPPPNQAPVAVVGGPYTTSQGTVNFDGSASNDPDGDLPLTYRWTFGDGTGSATTAQASYTYDANGTYNVSLVVTDAKGLASAPAATTAQVSRADSTVVFTGAGNIASGGNNDAATAALLDPQPGYVFTAGDNAFPDGSVEDYLQRYEPTWGRHKARTYAALGNHDYQTSNAAGSFEYFGERVGPRDKGYYSVNLGAWHIIVLNDNIAYGPGSAQEDWLKADLAASSTRCTLALVHFPLFMSTNTQGYTSSPSHKSLWDVLYAAGADVVVSGQFHHYERLAPMNPAGELDAANGLRSFNVGTGGESLLLPTNALHPNSEVRAAVFGVLKLTLKRDGYDWAFLPVPGQSFQDAGSGSCH